MKKNPSTSSGLKREFSAGAVVFKKSVVSCQLSVVFLIGKHSGYHKWVLPKGLIEPGEKGWQTALRETEEEMGIKAKLVSQKPIHKEEYFFVADFKKNNLKSQNSNVKTKSQMSKLKDNTEKITTRRVLVYQEQGGNKIKVFKTVTFYLAEYLSGESKNHGWEMSEAGWYSYKEALKKLAFDGEKEALKKAKQLITQ